MQENHRNGQDDSDIVETSAPFTIKRAALKSRPVTRGRCRGGETPGKLFAALGKMLDIVENYWT